MRETVTVAPSLWSAWRELLVLLVASNAFTLLVGRLLFDDQVLKSLRRSRAAVVDLLNKWYAERRRQIDDALKKVDPLEDRMELFEASLLQQGETLRETMSDHATRQTKALETMTATLAEIQKEAAATTTLVARIDERTKRQPWDGVTERRANDRRGGPNS